MIRSSQCRIDIWGIWISGVAPIKDKNGEIVAELGIDIDAREVEFLSRKILSPVVLFSALSPLFVLMRLTTFGSPRFLKFLRWE